MAPYTATRQIKLGKVYFQAGEELEMDEATAAPLREAGAIRLPGEEPPRGDTLPVPGVIFDNDPQGRPAELDLRETAQDARAAELDDWSLRLDERVKRLDSRETSLDGREVGLDTREQALKGKEWLLSDPGFRESRLKAAIKRVVEGKAPADFTQGGLPTADAIDRECPGDNITATERNQWFAELYPEKGEGD